MAKNRSNPFMPQAGMSPFEIRLSGKIELTPEQDHRRLGGCGDPDCDMCNPKDGRGGKAPAGDASRRGGRSGADAADAATYFRMASRMGLISSSDYILEGSSRNSQSNRDAQLDRELAEAREAVKEYLLETSHSVGWDDVIGNQRARTALLEAIEDPIKNRDLNKHYGIKPSKGVMLYGPPGCGKTMFGKAAASALARLHGKSVELLVINGPQIQSPYVGMTEKIIREIFAYARLYHRKHGHQLVVFIDEADASLPSRDGGPMWNASNVATFLTEMDGMEDSGAFVLLATNRPETLDQALLRDGRCDRKIKVELPGKDAALAILTNAIATAPLAAGRSGLVEAIDHLFDASHTLQELRNPMSGTTHHFTLGHIVSGAMVVGLVNRAKGIAFRRDRDAGTLSGVAGADLCQAVDEVLLENKGLNHAYALREFLEDVALPAEMAIAERTGALN